MTKKLSLNRETVRELVDANLGQAFGGEITGTETTPYLCGTTFLHTKVCTVVNPDANLSQLICQITYQPRCF
ncbi:MAG TPA: hypothetical protein VG245_05820 [Candidatus Dormibacteraeota bacterium]|jgi:hypothetical protein|nr:hypothetical protein [Candidatus Dormibacteraeota bacterium]